MKLKTKSNKPTAQTKSSKFKKVLKFFQFPKPVQYIFKLFGALLCEMFLIEIANSMALDLTKTGLASISNVKGDANTAVAANILNQQLNLMTATMALLIAISMIAWVWILIIKPFHRALKKYSVWLNTES